MILFKPEMAVLGKMNILSSDMLNAVVILLTTCEAKLVVSWYFAVDQLKLLNQRYKLLSAQALLYVI